MSLVSSIVALAQAIGDDIKSLTATLDDKVDKVSGKGLSANDYTTTDKNKLAGIAAGATANAGTVTSVGLSVPTGFAVSSAITTSGTIAVTYAAGYGLPTTTKQGQWDAAYGWGNHASAGYSTQTVSAGTGLDLTSSTLSVKYGTASGTAAQGNDSRLSDARTPTSHTHGAITNDGKIGTTANLVVVTGSGGTLTAKAAGSSGQFLAYNGAWATPPDNNTTYSAGTGLSSTGTAFSVKYGTTSGTAAQGNDSRITGAFPASGGALTGGATGPAAVSDGTKSSGTYTPSPGTGNWRKITNGGAHTIAAPTTSGCYNMTVDITNNSSAGAITFSGFVAGYPKGDDLTTTNGNKFKLHIFKSDLGVTAFIEALQ